MLGNDWFSWPNPIGSSVGWDKVPRPRLGRHDNRAARANMKLPTTITFSILLTLLSSLASCMDLGQTCGALLSRINQHRTQNGLEVIDEKVFLPKLGGNSPECRKILQKILDYAAERDTAINFCEGEKVCTLTREQIKRGIAHGLLGNYKKSLQNIGYHSSSQDQLFPEYLKNYFVDDAHDDHRVTAELHKLDPAKLRQDGKFQPFLLVDGAIGENESVVAVIPMQLNFFYNDGLTWTVLEHRVRERHLDLMLASQFVDGEIPADAAVLVSDFQTFSNAAGRSVFNPTNRKLLFLDAKTYVDEENPYKAFEQYQWANVVHEITKAKAGFSAVPRDQVIETGLWGCGIAYAGDEYLRLLIQMLAAAETVTCCNSRSSMPITRKSPI